MEDELGGGTYSDVRVVVGGEGTYSDVLVVVVVVCTGGGGFTE